MEEPVFSSSNRTFMNKGMSQALDFLESTLQRKSKVIDIIPPEELKSRIDFTISEEPCDSDELLSLTSNILSMQTKPYHPNFHNQLFGGFDQYSVIGAMIAPTLNDGQGGMALGASSSSTEDKTKKMSELLIGMETEVYEMFRKLLKWEHIDGILTPGGSFANFMAISTARFKLDPESRNRGNLDSQKEKVNGYKIFTSETSHYSMKKGAVFCGIGENSVIYVKSDKSGKMIPEELEKSIQAELVKGKNEDCGSGIGTNIDKNPSSSLMLVNATMGTTVEGNVDPIEEIGKICKKYKIWFHVDGALGGSLIFSEKEMSSYSVNMFENVDSFAVDPHKALVVPLQCSLFLTKHKEILKEANRVLDKEEEKEKNFEDKHNEKSSECLSLKAESNLIRSHRHNLTYEEDRSLQENRVADIFKFWIYLQAHSLKGMAEQIEQERALTLYCKQYILSNSERWILVVDDVETINVCFWYVPVGLSEEQFSGDREKFRERLSQITVLAKKFMIEEGKMLVGYSKSQVKHYFWRTVMSNPFLENKDVDYEMELLAKYCEQANKEITQEQISKQKE